MEISIKFPKAFNKSFNYCKHVEIKFKNVVILRRLHSILSVQDIFLISYFENLLNAFLRSNKSKIGCG